ncbi:PAS domain S-box protein [Ramlibacter sp.]|uniref:PAS domain-containing sensor histidine kinase n=1 Tax=Ramlibacter sp. TaxID=1917967 RepID=UPI0017F8D99E|nr:PAS domain S-box protein [Ramlibacter sp.]MBA2674259.1 PAS domain S-box protein [Ramlibacter sp.]
MNTPPPPAQAASVTPLSEQQFAAIFEFASIGMALLDTESRVLRVNRTLCEMLGRTEAELAGARGVDLVGLDDIARDRELRGLMLDGMFPSYQAEKRYHHADGHQVWTHQICTLVRDEQGRPAHFIVQAQDVSDRKAAEAALRESEERFRATFEQAALGILHVGMDGRMLRVNRKLCEMHGYSREELLGMRSAGDLSVDGGEAGRVASRRLLSGEVASYSQQRRFIRKDGSQYDARVSATVVRDAAEPYFVSIVEDISQAVADQRRIREQAQMLDQANDAILVASMDRRILYWNHGAERLFGWRAQQAVGRPFGELMGAASTISDSDTAKLLAQGHWTALVPCRTADGRLLDVERRFTLIRDEQGQPAAVVSVSTDVTQRLAAERALHALNSDLEQRIRARTAELQDTNEELRSIAYSLAHDLRAPLAAIDGFSLELARRAEAGLDDASRHYLHRVRAGVRAIGELTEAMLSLMSLSQAPLLPQGVDLSALAQGWVHRMRQQQPGRQVTVDIAPTPRAEGDARLLAELMEQLLANAWKFTGNRPHGHIAFGVLPHVPGGPNAAPVYVVRDNGAGFDPTYAAKLFVPFQRLHGVGEFPGTGIGLAIARKIVARHGGRIWAESHEGQGAAFYFTLGDSGAAGGATMGA